MQVLTQRFRFSAISPDKVLSNIVKSWIGVALFGQWLFAAYIISLYALPTLIMGNASLTLDLSPAGGAKAENNFNSITFFVHVLPAALMAMSGLLQLFPSIRRNYPKFHRYNGRMFFVLGLSGAFTGLYLTWGAGFRFSDIGALGITLNGLLIPIAIIFAWRTAIKKQLKAHQRFAVHSFLLVNGVWTFRLYLMGWYVINQGANGNTKTIDGPADIALSFACYLLPMAIAEFVFWAQRTRNQGIKWLACGVVSLGVIVTFIGVSAATMMMWYPRINSVIEGLIQ